MNTSVANKKKLINILLIIISIILIALGFYHLYQENQYVKNGVKTSAVVINVLRHPERTEGQTEDEYKRALEQYNILLEDYRRQGIIKDSTAIAIIINYEYNGKEYITELGYFSGELTIASTVTIYINKDNPSDFIYEGANKFGLYFCMIVGSVMLIFSVVFFFINKYNNKINVTLLQKGKLIQAEIIYADEEETKSSFEKHPFIFTCVYFDEEKEEQIYFTSESVYCKKMGSKYIGEKVNIYVDPNDYTNYYIDLKLFEQ